MRKVAHLHDRAAAPADRHEELDDVVGVETAGSRHEGCEQYALGPQLGQVFVQILDVVGDDDGLGMVLGESMRKVRFAFNENSRRTAREDAAGNHAAADSRHYHPIVLRGQAGNFCCRSLAENRG